MNKEYKVQPYKAPGFYATIAFVLMSVYIYYIAARMIISGKRTFSEDWPVFLFIFIVNIFMVFFGYYFLSEKIIVSDSGIILKKLDKTISVTWDEITKVERTMAIGVCTYIVRTKDKRKNLEFPDYIENYEEILDEIYRRTDIHPKWKKGFV